MPTEACYVVSIENAILLSAAYGILSVYFEDVMSYGFLFFAVLIGLCLSYLSIVAGFCLLLFDEDASKQIILLDSNRPTSSSTPQVALLSRVLARSGTICSVALFIVFVTVGLEFFTDDNVSDNLPRIALKKIETEAHLTTQMAVSAAFVVFFMIVLMLVCNNQQVNGIVVRLQSLGESASEKSVLPSAFDDVALFVRALRISYLIVCDSSGTFQSLPHKAMPSFLLDAVAPLKGSVLTLQNPTSVLFIGWCLFVDLARAFAPHITAPAVFIELLGIPLVIGSILTVDVLLQDMTQTNLACMVLVICDVICVVYGSIQNMYHHSQDRNASQRARQSLPAQQMTLAAHPEISMSVFSNMNDTNASDLRFTGPTINLNNINLGFFEKKSN
jgi:hypothetical protein